MTQETDQLIAELAHVAEPVRPNRVSRRLALAGAVGAVLAVCIQFATTGLRPDASLAYGAIFMKIGAFVFFALALAWLLRKLASPGTARQNQINLVGTLAVAALVTASFGQSSLGDIAGCTQKVVLLALPALVLLTAALKRSAPTELGTTGFVAGILAGSIGVLGYSLGCMADDPTVVALRYSIAIVTSGVIGAAVGHWLLRW